MSQQATMVLVRTLHDLATAAWIGGMLALALGVIPAVRRSLGMGPQTVKLLSTIQDRLSVVMAISVVILLATGLLLGRRASATGVLATSDTYALALTIKHVLAGAMVVIAMVRSRVVPMSRMKVKAGLLALNIAFGFVVVTLSSLTTVIASGPLMR